ncbi:hypothetical protein JCM4814A_80040 [Streptomyces phaeofaciens JCM 4814]|uniref:N-acetyltransferase domain-containing protein n=1 Tax=Streptomyces phaeofaciens TaxID=68254 RepID=A0A918M0A9_9ACTN|nr:hypothetical protein GCM10010226_82140 [Streptomyces phaeofaciens]
MWWGLRRTDRAVPLPLVGQCDDRRHVLRTDSFLFYTPRIRLDTAVRTALASDPQAQHWLGWGRDNIVADPVTREALTFLRPGALPAELPPELHDAFDPPRDGKERLVGVRLDGGRYAADITLDTDSGEIGAVFAPHTRGLGLGGELFRAAARLGHEHCGLSLVRARFEAGNAASARALAGADFTPAGSPFRFTLPAGRAVHCRWSEHATDEATSRCEAGRSTLRASRLS